MQCNATQKRDPRRKPAEVTQRMPVTHSSAPRKRPRFLTRLHRPSNNGSERCTLILWPRYRVLELRRPQTLIRLKSWHLDRSTGRSAVQVALLSFFARTSHPQRRRGRMHASEKRSEKRGGSLQRRHLPYLPPSPRQHGKSGTSLPKRQTTAPTFGEGVTAAGAPSLPRLFSARSPTPEQEESVSI